MRMTQTKESMLSTVSISPDYWQNLEITPQDVESLHAHLFEVETPLTARDLATVFVEARLKSELEAGLKKRQSGAKTYIPKEGYIVGEELVFPALEWKKGRVTAGSPSRGRAV